MSTSQHIWIFRATNTFGWLTNHSLTYMILIESRYSFSSSISRCTSFDRSFSTIFPSPRLTRARRTWLPLPSVEITRAIRQSCRFTVSSTIMTRSPSFKSLLVDRHLERAWGSERYSVDHNFQKLLTRDCACFQVWRCTLSSPTFPGMIVAEE